MIAPLALALLPALAYAWESPPPPPPTEAEKAQWEYDRCLHQDAEAKLESAPISASAARAAVLRALAACRAEKADAIRKMRAVNFENAERGPLPGLERFESDLLNLLQKPKAPDAAN